MIKKDYKVKDDNIKKLKLYLKKQEQDGGNKNK
ncbi:hypothetical protein UFOVP627_25 [uncultured Caudovirales phage]|jgi:hypothetical protein|uniref:Uncharacterized protein n=1 Tax=uncultured Caudovirales phage TaxID=2100421 RepID=A0A6J5N597_9CAUD|nr:hypothetical protein UFOVP627_25 [uncultured Caudovirales phage]CAB5217798.1 hypothetical protein UFOVP206_20 [uncultured Caudovirales phage]